MRMLLLYDTILLTVHSFHRYLISTYIESDTYIVWMMYHLQLSCPNHLSMPASQGHGAWVGHPNLPSSAP